MITVGSNALNCRRRFNLAGQEYYFYSMSALNETGLGDFGKLPACLKVLVENLLRFEAMDGSGVKPIMAFKSWLENSGRHSEEIEFRPSRVLMQDFTGCLLYTSPSPRD